MSYFDEQSAWSWWSSRPLLRSEPFIFFPSSVHSVTALKADFLPSEPPGKPQIDQSWFQVRLQVSPSAPHPTNQIHPQSTKTGRLEEIPNLGWVLVKWKNESVKLR